MVVSSATNQVVSLLHQGISEALGVLEHLLLVSDVLRTLGLLESSSKSGNGVVVGATLAAREDGEVDLVLQIVVNLLALLILRAETLSVEDHSTTRATERLVGGGSDNVRVFESRGNHASSNQARDMGNVGKEPRVVEVANLAHALVVNEASVGRSAGNDQLGSVQLSVLLHLVVVDNASLLVQAVREGLEEDRHSRDLLGVGLVAVTEVAAVRKVQSHDAVVGLQDGSVGLEVGGRAGQRLHVHAPLSRVQVESIQSALLAERLGLVDVLIAAIVSGAGIALTVLVTHDGTQGVEDTLGGEVLGSDQDEGIALTNLLVLDDIEQLGVGLIERLVHATGPLCNSRDKTKNMRNIVQTKRIQSEKSKV